MRNDCNESRVSLGDEGSVLELMVIVVQICNRSLGQFKRVSFVVSEFHLNLKKHKKQKVGGGKSRNNPYM